MRQYASWTTLWERLVKMARGSCATAAPSPFAEVAVPRALFAAILRRIDRLRGPPLPAA